MERLSAHITGTVVRIEKKPGEAVGPGEAVVILESMKMEMPVEATSGGRVKELRCAEGQAVAEGDLLAVIE
jgi:acetyl-CoA carboxylase biotin carboxyl carrier protein